MASDTCWLNISLKQEDLKDVRTFAKQFKATLPAGTSVSLSSAVRIAIKEGINSLRGKWDAQHHQNPQPPVEIKGGSFKDGIICTNTGIYQAVTEENPAQE